MNLRLIVFCVTLMLISVLFVVKSYAQSNSKMKLHYFKKDTLKTIKKDWLGNPQINGNFINQDINPMSSFSTFLKWRFSKNSQKEEKKNDTWRPAVIKNNTLSEVKDNSIIWLGHASFLIRANGKSILIDPMFYSLPFIKREVELPCLPEDLKNIDYVLLSHGHMDHCNKKSLQVLSKNNNFTLLTPLKLNDLVKSWIPSITSQDAGWYQQFNLPDDSVQIFMLPALHWYKRTLFDTNKMLWGSFIIKTKDITIYVSGDSGYDTHFKEIGKLFPDIDLCIMGVGAYKPDYMMKHVHMSPQDAVDAFHDLNGKLFIPMHYGTFDLADEPMGEPIRILKKMEADKQISGELKVLDIGEVLFY